MNTPTKLEHEAAIAIDDVRTVLVFDYFGSHQKDLTELLKEHPDYEVVLFGTRNHPDLSRHSVFEVLQQRNPIYVLTNDIPARLIPSTARVQGISHGDVVEIGDLTVRAYGAEDNGIAFVVKNEKSGETIFYGGPLPQKALHLLSEENPQLTVAFCPEEQQQALEQAVKVGKFIPIKA